MHEFTAVSWVHTETLDINNKKIAAAKRRGSHQNHISSLRANTALSKVGLFCVTDGKTAVQACSCEGYPRATDFYS